MIPKITKGLLSFLTLALFASCTWEYDIPVPETGENNEVVFSMRIPGNYTLTRSLTEADEYEVQTLDVLVFNNSDGTLLSRSTNSGTPKVEDRNVDFYVRLEKDDNVDRYDFILLANTRDLITSKLYTNGELNKGWSKSDVQEVLKAELTAGKGWITDKNDAAYKAIPMWAEVISQPIEAGKIYPRANMTRATIKIDIEVELDGSGNSFDLMEVRYYHYHTEGYIIPLDGNLTGGKATEPTIDGLTLHTTQPIDYTAAISPDKQSLTSAIYGFEGPAGSMGSDYLHNPCLLIKGEFNGTPGWYRLDFANVDENTLQSTYLPLLRNHQYNLKITAINGPGFPDPDEALNSKPGNVITNITIWDGEDVGGVWNGNYEIKFTSLEAHFTQFGQPTPQVVTIKTNCPSLTFDNFTNIKGGATDTEWTESIPGKWSNGHFEVTIVQGSTVGNITTYTLTITAKQTVNPDPARESRFKIKGSNMEANFRITQEMHVIWRLMADPDPMNAIMIDGAAQRIRINVTSTHEYKVDLNTTGGVAMFSGVYDVPTGGSPLDATGLSKDLTTIYIATDKYSEINPRIGTFVISHTEPASEAAPLTFNILQVTPAITAVLHEGGYTAELTQAGGSHLIRVESNMYEWIPVLTYRIDAGPEIPVTTDADLMEYFGITQGTDDMDVTFTAPPITGNKDYIYTITFRDANSTVESTPTITITQIAKLPGGGGGGIPPTDGVRAEEFILSVNSKGQLNLDGDGYLVYFKWGSTIAISGGPENDPFTSDKIAWVPDEYNYNALIAAIDLPTVAYKWSVVPYQSAGSTIIEDPVAGTGDPCKLAIKNGVVGGHRMPTGHPSYEESVTSSWETSNGMKGRRARATNQFYPAAGVRHHENGMLYGLNSYGYYFSSSHSHNSGFPYAAKCLNFSSMGSYPNSMNARFFGFTIRCLPE